MAYEQTIRLSFFFGVLAVIAIWEVITPRRTLTNCKRRRWLANLSLGKIAMLVSAINENSAVKVLENI